MAYRTIAGFEQPLPGSYERGNREKARQDALIQDAGGVVNYMRGAKPRPRDNLTTACKSDTMGGEYQPTPPPKDGQSAA